MSAPRDQRPPVPAGEAAGGEPVLIDTGGRRIGHRDLRRAMRVNIAAGAVGMIWFAVANGMPLTMFMEAAGASGVLIGLITTVRLVATGCQIPGALCAERLASRKRFWAPLVLMQRFLWFGMAALALQAGPRAPWVPLAAVAIVGCGDMLAQAGGAAWLSWMTDLIPLRTSARFWGVRQSIVTTSSLLGLAFSGWLLDRYRHPVTGAVAMEGFALVFAVGTVLGVADIVVHLWVREPRPTPHEADRPLLARLIAPFREGDFRRLTLAIGCWNFLCSLLATFGIVYLKRDFAASYSQLAMMAIAGGVGAAICGAFFGKIIDRLGARSFGALLFILTPVTALSWFFVHGETVAIGPWRLPQAVALQTGVAFISGGMFSAVLLCQMRLLALVAPTAGRTVAMAVHWSGIGLIAAAGPVVGGIVLDWFEAHPVTWIFPWGTALSFFHVLILLFAVGTWTLVLPLFLRLRPVPTDVPFATTFSGIVLTNPLQVVRNFYNLHIMTAHTTRHQRAMAARRLGLIRNELAVPDLIDRLDDPSPGVREEAVDALGSIGGGRAVGALMAKLADPDDDLRPAVAKALRAARDPRAVEPLLAHIASPDRATRREVVRALGAIGDRRAIPALLDFLRGTTDNSLLAAASEALAALGEVSAAYQIVPQLRAATGRSLKRAMAVAVGDLLGAREGFYKLLVGETETPGSGVTEVGDRLRRAIRRQFPSALRQIEALDRIEEATTDGDVSRAADLLLHLGLHVIQFIYRVPLSSDPGEAMHNLLERDRRAALCVWFLKIVAEPWTDGGGGRDRRETTDVLLGLYLVASIAADTGRSPLLAADPVPEALP